MYGQGAGDEKGTFPMRCSHLRCVGSKIFMHVRMHAHTHAHLTYYRPKAYTQCKNYHFPYTKSIEGGGGGPKCTNFERTHFMDGPCARAVHIQTFLNVHTPPGFHPSMNINISSSKHWYVHRRKLWYQIYIKNLF